MARGSRIQGITIELDGDASKFQKSITDLDKSIKQTQGALNDVNKLLKLDPKNTELLAQKQQLLAKAIEDTKSKLDLLKQAQAEMDAKGVDKTSDEYQRLQREIIATEQYLQKLEAQAGKSKTALDKIAETGEKLKKVGGSIESAGKALMPVSAAAGAAVAGLAGLGYKAVTAADDLNTLSKQTGISTDDLQKMTYASDLIDVSLETITGSMTKLKKNMASSSSGTVEAWNKIGVSVKNADGSMRNATDVFYDALEGLSKIENETERDQLAMQLFGKSADQLAGIIDDGGAALKAYGQEAENMGLIMSGDTLNRLNETNDQIDKMKATFGASIMELGATVAQVLAPIVEKVSGILSKVAEKIRNLTPEQTQLIMTIGSVVAALAPVLVIGGKLINGIGTVMTSLKEIVPVIAGISAPVMIVIAAIAALVAVFVTLYNTNEDFRNKVNEIWAQIQETFTTVINKIKEVVSAFFAILKQWWAENGEWLIETVTSIYTSIYQTISAALELAKKIIDSVLSWVRDFWSKHGEQIKDIASKAWEFIKTKIQFFTDLIRDIFSVFTALLRGDWSQAWESIKTLLSNAWINIRDILRAGTELAKSILRLALDVAKEIWSNAWEAIKQKLSEIWDAIKDIVSKLKEGIEEKIGEVKTVIETKIGEAMDYIKNLPAKALQWGRDLITNFIAGIREHMSELNDVAEEAAMSMDDYMGFSEPKKGPLSDFHTFAPDMIDLFTQGVRDNLWKISDVMNDMSGIIAGDMSRTANITMTTPVYLDGQVIATVVNERLGAMI